MIYSNKEYSVFGNMCKTTDGDNFKFVSRSQVSRHSVQTDPSSSFGRPSKPQPGSSVRPPPRRLATAAMNRKVEAPQHGALRDELASPGTPAAAVKKGAAAAAAHEQPTQPQQPTQLAQTPPLPGKALEEPAGEVTQPCGAKRGRDDDGEAAAAGPPAKHSLAKRAEPNQAHLLALYSNAGMGDQRAALRISEAVQDGALSLPDDEDILAAATQQQQSEHAISGGADEIQEEFAMTTLDPMCCVGCGIELRDLAPLGLKAAPTLWEWRCQACIPTARFDSYEATPECGTPEQ